MSKLRLSLACWNYDRTRALRDGTAQADGIDLNYLNMPVEETFFRMLRHREFDVAEMSLSSYAVSLSKPERPFIAIPVFPSRFFRHSCIYVNSASGIREPKDLIGKRVGNPEYQMTAPVWIRGILADEYSVPIDAVTYCTGGEEEPGRPEKLNLALPANITVSTSYHCNSRFPIMHTVAIRRDVYERDRWIAQSLYKAFCAAQRMTYADLNDTAALKVMLPWTTAHVEDARREMGDDFWPYGFDRNRDALSTFLRYHHEQGLSGRQLEPEELFAPETLEAFRI